jgi:hypothetical protein
VIVLIAFVPSPASLAVAGAYIAAAPPSPATVDVAEQVLSGSASRLLTDAVLRGFS